MRRALRTPLLAFVGVLASCATGLPDYARPTGQVMSPATYTATDVIPYRKLSRADFRGASPPEQIAAHASEFGAYTCASVVPESFDLEFAIDSDPESGEYVARAPGNRFRAEMDRECSWWNPDGTPWPSEYTLQHEQIHFAIVEIEARRLEQDVAGLQGRGSSPQAAVNDLQRRLDSLAKEAMHRVLRENTRFDEETSGVYAPKRQAEWAQRVEAQLE